jgi:hypothetical protein
LIADLVCGGEASALAPFAPSRAGTEAATAAANGTA